MKHIQLGFALLAASLLCATPLSAGMANPPVPQPTCPTTTGAPAAETARTAEEITDDALIIDYPYPEWSEIPIVLRNDEAQHFHWGDGLLCFNDTEEGVLTATLTTDKPTTFVYSLYAGGNPSSFTVYIDDEKVRTIDGYQCPNSGMSYSNRYFEELTPGQHTIRIVFYKEAEGGYLQYSAPRTWAPSPRPPSK